MRVLAFCDYYGSSSIGGAERVAHEVYERLVRDHGVEVTVVGAIPAGGGQAPAFEGPDHAVRTVSVRGLDLSKLLGGQLMIGRGLLRTAHETAGRIQPDVIHINGLHFHSSAVGLRIARRHTVPVVTTAHLADVAAMPGRTQLAARGLDRYLGGRIIRASQAVMAVSEAVANHMAELGAEPERVRVAHNGVDHTRFHPRLGAPRMPWLRAVVVGRLIATKGIAHALEAVAEARAQGRDVRLTVIGDGPLARDIAARAAAVDLTGAVELVGRVHDVETWLAKADVALRPSFTEGLPLAVLEALASGVPVICSDVPGNTEVVRDGHNGLVVPVADVRALAGALIRLHDDRAALQRLSVEAADSAAPFTWEATAEAHHSAFGSAVRDQRVTTGLAS